MLGWLRWNKWDGAERAEAGEGSYYLAVSKESMSNAGFSEKTCLLLGPAFSSRLCVSQPFSWSRAC